jgi:6-phospho-3-hexuloisomerase
MNACEYSLEIVQELKKTLSEVNPDSVEVLISHIIKANRVFVAAAGRSALSIKAFAMRLMHLGLTVYVMGEIVTPAISEGDLLLIGSGSGETDSLVVTAKRAKRFSADLALVTIFPGSSIGRIADEVVCINAPTSKANTNFVSIQPGGSCFEQSMLLLLDACVIRIAETLQLDAEENLKLRHANLE